MNVQSLLTSGVVSLIANKRGKLSQLSWLLVPTYLLMCSENMLTL